LLLAAPATAPPQGQKGPGLKLEQKAIFESNAEMTSLLSFHPFENILVSTDEHFGITVWDYEQGKRIGSFSNGNVKPFRLTTMGWLNETSSSLLLTGSDDGAVRCVSTPSVSS
jgi:regulatory associated protein of mTOR